MKSYEALVKAINEGSYTSIDKIRNNPIPAAAVSKLVKDPINPRPDFEDESAYAGYLHKLNLEDTSFKIADSKRNNDSMMQLFPEMELASQILISSVLSPKDMIENKLIYNSTVENIPADIKSKLLKNVSEYIDENYKLTEDLPDILKEILFITGSYVTAVIPESRVDAFINNPLSLSKESFEAIETERLGFLGDPTAKSNIFISFESTNLVTQINDKIKDLKTELITVTDNYDTLKLNHIGKSYTKERLNNILNKKKVALESSSLYSTNKIGSKPYFNFSNISPIRKSIGKPLKMRINSEAVIPVHVPGNPKEHIAYFILVDESGNPVNRFINAFDSLVIDGSSDFSNNLIERSKNAIIGNSNMNNTTKINDVFSDIVEQDLLNRLQNGIYGKNAEISKNNDVYRLMLARTLKGFNTKILFLPAEFVSYIANDYHENGVGKTLTDKMRILNSVRAMTLFSRVMAGVKNSIGVTEVKLKLDERDGDPNKTIETAVHEILKTRQQSFPVGINTPNDIVDWVQKTGLEFVFEGHPKIPNMGFEFNQKGNSSTKPDTELDDELSKRAIMALGLNPDIVTNANSPEFAASVHANNLLFSKTTNRIQLKITPLITYYIKLLIVNDSILVTKLAKLIEETKQKSKELNIEHIEEINLTEFIESISVSLPSPDISQVKMFAEALNEYIEYITVALDAFFSTDFINATVSGDFSGSVDDVKNVIKFYYIRKWIADNNALPELTELTETDEIDTYLTKPFEEQSVYIKRIITLVTRFVNSVQEVKIAGSADMTKLNGDGYSSDSSDGSDEGSEGLGTGGDTEDLDSLGMDEPETKETDSTDETDDTKPEATEKPIETPKEEPKKEEEKK